MVERMSRPFLWIVIVALCRPVAVAADVLELKDNASVSGRILAEKGDQVFLDLGFTVLAVPRSAIERIARAAPGAAVAGKSVPITKAGGPEPDKGLYTAGGVPKAT